MGYSYDFNTQVKCEYLFDSLKIFAPEPIGFHTEKWRRIIDVGGDVGKRFLNSQLSKENTGNRDLLGLV